jgi:hypothetical protein
MAQRKAAQGGTDQYKRFVEAARKLGTDESEEAFERVLRKVAKSPPLKAKKAARKAKR